MTPKLIAVVGARPNFVKVAPVLHALEDAGGIDVKVLNTGQHYDHKLAGAFLEQLRFPPVDFSLGVGSGSHAEQTAAVLVGAERILARERPQAVLVAGDVNSTLAAALAAAKLGIKVIHLESGLRSGDWEMPEEINRVLTDRLSDLLLCHCDDAIENLLREGIALDRIALVGNTMIDSLDRLLPSARASNIGAELGVQPHRYMLVTLHRPALVDDVARLLDLLRVLNVFAARIPVLLPLHPRTRAALDKHGAAVPKAITTLGPLEYLDFIALQADARLVVTDSGGVQEETSALGVPCLTYRTTTERPVTVTLGTNQLVGVDSSALQRACDAVLNRDPDGPLGRIPLWDGFAGQRAAEAMAPVLQ